MATRTTDRQVWRGRSEYTGEQRLNTLAEKEKGAPLDAEERMRLLKHTGTEDITAEPDGRSWLGWKKTPESVIDFTD